MLLQTESSHIDITWAAVGALTVLCGAIAGLIYWAICSTIDSRLAKFLTQLNGTYVRTPLCKVATADLKRELDKHEARISSLEELG